MEENSCLYVDDDVHVTEESEDKSDIVVEYYDSVVVDIEDMPPPK